MIEMNGRVGVVALPNPMRLKFVRWARHRKNPIPFRKLRVSQILVDQIYFDSKKVDLIRNSRAEKLFWGEKI